jgi:hypothetical protein
MRVTVRSDAVAVTEDGRVFRVARPRSGRACPYELKPHLGKRGYLTVAIDKQTTPVHVLVAETFISNPQGKPEIAHCDGNKLNNHVSNLRWATRKENNDDRFGHGTVLQADNHPTRKLSSLEVKTIRRLYAGGGWFHRELAEIYGVTRECVTQVCGRKRWKTV